MNFFQLSDLTVVLYACILLFSIGTPYRVCI